MLIMIFLIVIVDLIIVIVVEVVVVEFVGVVAVVVVERRHVIALRVRTALAEFPRVWPAVGLRPGVKNGA